MLLLILAVLGYLVGAVPVGVLVARAVGAEDPRGAGSGNVGATNVTRVAGRRAGLVTLAGDAGKGALPVLLAAGCGLGPSGQALVGVAAVVGHVFPVTLGWSGGKGVATGGAVFLVLAPVATLAAVLVYAAAFAATRTSSVGSLAGAATLLVGLTVGGAALPVLLAALAVVALVVVRHRDNIRRLRSRQELGVLP